jgi:pimeloyl-ACP methyl ester carboxylesterase
MVHDYAGWHWANSEQDRNVRLAPPAIERLQEIGVPALALVGELDLHDYRRIASILERDVPNARSVVLRSAGHMANMEAPEEFNRIVLDFLDAL